MPYSAAFIITQLCDCRLEKSVQGADLWKAVWAAHAKI